MNTATRVLFFAEAVTLAHVARPYRLATALDPERYEVLFACAPHFQTLFPAWPWHTEHLSTPKPAAFVDRLARGARLYELQTLRQYVEEDLRIISALKPDVVVGDFRLSLSVSARIARTPYIALGNAYWSPYAADRHIPTPCLPITRHLPLWLASRLFALGRPVAFAWHAVPLNLLRREHGLPALGLDLRRIYTDADDTLYADVPELVPTVALPPNHRYLGAVSWSPELPMPTLPVVPATTPLIYVTLGSSGSGDLLPSILEALADLDCQVVVAAAGRRPSKVPSNAFVTDYLPGERMAAMSRLVICNGGSPTSQQALMHGVPVLGLPDNLDQHLNMQYLVRTGAGRTVRPEQATPARIRAAATALLEDAAAHAAACRLRDAFAAHNCDDVFRAVLESAGGAVAAH